jgi:hypothetical protein
MPNTKVTNTQQSRILITLSLPIPTTTYNHRIMKLALLFFAAVASAIPAAEPVASSELATPDADELLPRQLNSRCFVKGRGSLNV